jgi:hypothetical protein
MAQSDKLPDVKSDDSFINKALKRNEFPPDSYFEEEHKKYHSSKSLYEIAYKLEIRGAYEIENLKPDEQLKRIKNEIVFRTKITAHEIFKIGGLLTMAKMVCSVNHIRFREWITTNFDFSYETGLNFMHVYQNCLGMHDVAIHRPLSILYKIAAPSFPMELREYLFTQRNINSITDMDLKDLSDRYKEGGFEAIRESVDKWNFEYDVFEQTQFVLDRCRGLVCEMTSNKHKIMNKYGYYKENRFIQTDRELLPVADEINKKLLNAIYEGIGILEEAIKEAEMTSLQYYYNRQDELLA